MTTKAISYILKGMMEDEKNVLIDRLTAVLAALDDPEIIDAITDGMLIDVNVVNENKLFTKMQEKAPSLKRISKTYVRMDRGLAYLNIEYTTKVFRKENGKEFDFRSEKNDVYCVEGERMSVHGEINPSREVLANYGLSGIYL